jgi:hypothetical protein
MKTKKVKRNPIDRVILNGVLMVLKNRKTNWIGTMTELSDALVKNLKSTEFPTAPNALRVVLNRVLRRLRRENIKTTFMKTHAGRFVEFQVPQT